MKVEISTHEAANQLLRDENASWSRPAAFAIAEYYEELQEDHGYGCDSEIEFCWVAIRCYFTEYKSIQEAASYYSLSPNVLNDESLLEWFSDETLVITTDGDAVVIQDF